MAHTFEPNKYIGEWKLFHNQWFPESDTLSHKLLLIQTVHFTNDYYIQTNKTRFAQMKNTSVA